MPPLLKLKVVFYISDVIMQYKTMLDASGFASGAQRMNSHLGEMGIRTQAASTNLGGLGSVMGTLGGGPATIAIAAFVALGGALVSSAQAAAAWETSMSGVAKTTGLAGPELAALSQELLTMSTNMPIAASELANIAQAGGSLGIAKDELGAFSEVASKMGIGFGMAADQAATAGAKILNSFGVAMDSKNLEKLGSVVNTMGDSFAATEPQVLDFLNRASFLNSTMGQSIPQVAALGTTLISTGMEAEVAATGIKSMLNMLTSETSKKGGMDNWAKLMGVSVDELKGKVADDLNSTLIETANKIVAIEDPVARFQAAVAAAGTEGAPALLKLAGQQDNYTKALGMSNAEWEKAQSLQKTYEAQLGTLNSEWTMFTNTITMAATQMGTGMLPVLAEAVSFMTDLVKVGMKVGETLSDWGAGDAIKKVWDATPIGMITGSEAVKDAWGDVKEWAGIGETHAETMAAEISENEKLQNAGAEAIKAGEDAGVFAAGEAGKAAGEEAGDKLADAISKYTKEGISKELAFWMAEGNISDVAALGMVNQYSQRDGYAEDIVGKTTIGGAEFIIDTGNTLTLPDGKTKYFDFNDSASFWDSVYGYINGWAKTTMTDEQKAELRDDVQALVRLKANVEIEVENKWEQVDSQRSWMKFTDENKDLAKNAGDEIIYELYNAEQAAIKANDPTLTESLSYVMKGLAEPGSVPEQIFNQALADLIDVGYVAEGHKAAMQEIAKQDAEGYKSALFGTLKSGGETRTLADVIKSGGKGIADLPSWMANEYQPVLKTEIENMNKLWDSGLTDQRKVVEEDLDLLKQTHENHLDWFKDWQNQLIDIYQSGELSTGEFLDIWAKMGETAKEQAAAASEDFKSANAMFYGEFLADSAQWQDYVNEEGGYIGPTKLYGGYKDAVNAEIIAAQDVNAKYGISTVGSIGIELDTTLATEDMTALEEAVRASNPMMTVTATTQAAMDEVNQLISYIITGNPVMTVQVQIAAYADEIVYQVQEAIRSAVA